jgi:hypothetical protein
MGSLETTIAVVIAAAVRSNFRDSFMSNVLEGIEADDSRVVRVLAATGPIGPEYDASCEQA